MPFPSHTESCPVCLEIKSHQEYVILPCLHRLCTSCRRKLKVEICPFCSCSLQTKKEDEYLSKSLPETEHEFLKRTVSVSSKRSRVKGRTEWRRRRVAKSTVPEQELMFVMDGFDERRVLTEGEEESDEQ